MIRKIIPILLVTSTLMPSCIEKDAYLTITAETYRDKMKGAWIGQMAGVGWGLPTEFKFNDSIIPPDKVPEWTQEMINQQGNDDLYVEMTFLASMEKYGIDVSQRQAGIDFANTRYTLWAANNRGRENLRAGIAPPASSHPANNPNCDDIDYQIEADYSGIIAPGMPNVAIQLGEKFGRLMNYGDGLYGGQFVGGMYTEAYFNDDIDQIIEKGLECIPVESNYSKVIRDVIEWHKQYPEDWETTWNLIMNKYYRTLDNQPFLQQQEEAWVGIDSKINGAFIVLGLLYGNGDMDSTIIYSMRCGLDSDCNPSNAVGILATTIGYNNLPEKYKTGIDYEKNFAYTEYSFSKLLEISEQFTRELIARNQGEIIRDDSNTEIFKIKAQTPVPSKLQQSFNPDEPDQDNRYSQEEFSQITAWSSSAFTDYFESIGFESELRHAGKDAKPDPIQWNTKENVLVTTPMSVDRSIDIRLTRDLAADNNGRYFAFKAGHEKGESWRLIVNWDWVDTIVSAKNSNNGWMDIKIPINPADTILNIHIEAKNINNTTAKNYWADFGVQTHRHPELVSGSKSDLKF